MKYTACLDVGLSLLASFVYFFYWLNVVCEEVWSLGSTGIEERKQCRCCISAQRL